MILTIAAAALLQQTPAVPQRDTIPRVRTDTIYIGRRDTAAARPPAAPAPSAPGTPDAAPSSVPDSGGIFDAPSTRALVERTIRAGAQVPAELADYTADMNAAVYLSLRADSAQGGELPVTIDEFAGEVQWARGNNLVQRVRGHRVRMLAPTPYTVGSLIDAPWVIPHLYGNTITVFSLASTPGGRALASTAVHPFS